MKNDKYKGLLNTLKGLEDVLLQMAIHRGYNELERCVIILEDDPPAFFEALQPLMQYIRKHRLSQPLIITRRFVENSLDAYPLEFLDMQTQYRNLLENTDILAGLQFEKSDLRLQMERELRSKWLLTRQAGLTNPFRLKLLKSIIGESRTSLYPVLKGFFALSQQSVPHTLAEAIQKGESICGCELSLFSTPISGINDFSRYVEMLDQLIIKVQDWQI